MFDVIFNGTNLSTITGLDVHYYEFNLYPSRQMRAFKLANQNRSALTSAEYVDKEITVFAIARACDSEDAEQIMMNLRAVTQAFRKTLRINQYNTVVDYTATLQSMSHSWVGNNMKIEMTFYCDIPIGTDTTVEQLIAVLDENTTVSPTDYAITLGGSAIEQYPIITITINSLTIGAGGKITITNSANTNSIEISSTFVALNEIVIDTYAKLVTINGLEVNYVGRIPEFNVGTTDIVYSDDFSARNINLTAEYQKRYV